MRFIKEWFNPELKCERLIHNYLNKRHTIRRKGGVVPSVFCTDYLCLIPTCIRCGDHLKPYSEVEVVHHKKVIMHPSQWDELAKKGYVIL